MLFYLCIDNIVYLIGGVCFLEKFQHLKSAAVCVVEHIKMRNEEDWDIVFEHIIFGGVQPWFGWNTLKTKGGDPGEILQVQMGSAFSSSSSLVAGLSPSSPTWLVIASIVHKLARSQVLYIVFTNRLYHSPNTDSLCFSGSLTPFANKKSSQFLLIIIYTPLSSKS